MGYLTLDVEEFERLERENEILKAKLRAEDGFRKRVAEIVARNLVAWDTSKDKKLGLLPEVYLFNKALYKELNGEEYRFTNACKKFCIGDDWS